MANEKVKERMRNNRILLLAYIQEAKSGPCMDCGKQYKPYVMDFDHRNPKEKEFMISRAVERNVSIDKLKREIAKCDLICSNCHRERTFNSAAIV